MNLSERIEAALRNSPSFPFVLTCEVARENVIFDAASDLVDTESTDTENARDFGGAFGYWIFSAETVLKGMLKDWANS